MTALDGQDDSLQQQENWEARFKGIQPKYQGALSQITTLTNQIAEKSSELEQLRAQLGVVAAEKDRIASDFGTQFQTLKTQLSETQAQLEPLRQQNAKLKVAKENGFADLLPILDAIPYASDETVMKDTMSAFKNVIDKKVEEREKQLLSGVTPKTPATQVAVTLPTTNDGWREYLNGTSDQIEKDKRFNQFRAWGKTQGK